MVREAKRRKFFEASRKAFVADGRACNWSIHATHFRDFTPILDFTHAVSYLFEAATISYGKTNEAWPTYTRWMIATWQGRVSEVLVELQQQTMVQEQTMVNAQASLQEQERCLGPPTENGAAKTSERLREIIGYLKNNRERMRYDEYRCRGLPTTSAWMESTVKEMNYRVKGTEMFWNNPAGAEAILQLRAAALCDDSRLARFLTHRPGRAFTRLPTHTK